LHAQALDVAIPQSGLQILAVKGARTGILESGQHRRWPAKSLLGKLIVREREGKITHEHTRTCMNTEAQRRRDKQREREKERERKRKNEGEREARAHMYA